MIPLKYDNNTNTISDKDNAYASCRSSTETYEANTESNGVKYNVSRKTNKNSEQEKDGRYWKRRTSNNEAAKKSRDARKARLEWIENRAEELELENALLRKQLDNLTQEVLDKEKKGSMIKLV
jgi:preprotein translocase subunit SecD